MSEAVTRQLERAAQLLTQGRLPDALEAYRHIVQAVPAELSARQKIAEILARQGNKTAAVTEYSEVDVVVLEFPRESMGPVIAQHPGVRAGLEKFHRERMLANLIRANPLLQLLKPDQRAGLTKAFQPCTFAKDEVVLEEGAPGVAVFLLLRGRCSVTQSNSAGEYPDLVEGDAFGEISVLTKLPVSATIKARDSVLALCVMADDFRALVLANADVNKRVQQLASERMTRTAKMALQADADQWV